MTSITEKRSLPVTLKITTNQDKTTATLKLEGRVAGAWVSECFQAWQSIVSDLGTKTLCIDLRGVTFVDRSGAQLLAEIYRKHRAHFLTSTPLTKHFAESAARAANEEPALPVKPNGRRQ